MTKIGITYLKGSVPGFENFGNLPTDFVNSNGLVNGVEAHNELDALIIPGGTIVESGDFTDDLIKEIKLIANDGKPVIGICAGFQLLANQTDVGRKSQLPIIKKGIGLIDVNFSPLISSDRVTARVIDNSFLTNNQKDDITGFHCHTYGKIDGDAKPLFYSKIQRMNYSSNNKEILSGAVNDDGNVIGTLVHNCLDENPKLAENIFSYIGANEKEIENIYLKNSILKEKLTKEIGIKTGINIKNTIASDFSEFKNNGEGPRYLMIGSNGSDSGKTFILTGLAGALRKRGLKVALLKVGSDARDLVPGLYLTKGLMEDFNSIKIGHLGWLELETTIKQLKKSDYDLVLIEGVMSVFTGILNEKTPYSALEIAIAANIPMLLVTGVNKGGIESSAVDIVAQANMVEKFGCNVKGIILNKIYNKEIFDNAKKYIENNTSLDEVMFLNKEKLNYRGNTPEVEIKYDIFSISALNAIEKNLDIKKIASMSEKVEFNRYLEFEEIKKLFN